MKKTRLDHELVKQGFVSDMDEAKRWIMTGLVLVEDQPLDKPGTLIKPDSKIRIKKKTGRFVSRGGEKLAAALLAFQIPVLGRLALDLGASTGGFTDCLLQEGARKVYAVDVGTNQLVYRLRSDPRVVCLERTHARDLNRELVPEPIELLVSDVSFTSLTYVLPYTFGLLAPDADAVCLFKPQFEAPREKVAPGGLVDEKDAATALLSLEVWLHERGIPLLGKMKSPVKGREGNQEFLIRIKPPTRV